MLMPSHAKNVKLYNDSQPLFTRYGIEAQLDAMFSPVVQLKSGGYIVLNQTEALVAIDVNSGRATREHHIEDTALKTNLEAASEIARQLRLRDLAGLIVIDFIDMEEKRNNRAVERRLKEMLKNDRARIQVGRISHFGLLEMSRQRIRTSVLESSTEKCQLCGGTGHVRSVSSVTLQLLRSVEETLLKGPTHNLIVRTRAEVALYVLNTKRAHLRSLEERFQVRITVNADPEIGGHIPFTIERGEQVMSLEQAKALIAQPDSGPLLIEEDEEDAPIDVEAEEITEDAIEETAVEESGEETERERPARRRRGRGRRPEFERPQEAVPQFTDAEILPEDDARVPSEPVAAEAASEGRTETAESESERRRRRRGRRGGRRNRRERDPSGEIIPASDDLESPASDFTMVPEVPAPERDIADATYAPRMDQPASAPMDPPFATSEPRNDARMSTAGDAPLRADDQPAFQQVEPVRAAEPRTVERQDIEAPPPAHVPTPVPHAAESQQAEPKQSEPPRRRSTIREPAPILGGAQGDIASTPIPKPVVVVSHEPAPAATESAPQESDAAKPRRTGWWARRLAGGDN
jgi:ribonuclease E